MGMANSNIPEIRYMQVLVKDFAALYENEHTDGVCAVFYRIIVYRLTIRNTKTFQTASGKKVRYCSPHLQNPTISREISTIYDWRSTIYQHT